MRRWVRFLPALFFGFWGARGMIYATLADTWSALFWHMTLFVFALVIAVDNWPRLK